MTETQITLRRVAQLAGVSTATVARVMRRDPHVAPETRERVETVLGITGYQVNAAARGLRRRRMGTIGHLVHGQTSNIFLAAVALGLHEAAGEHALDVVTANSQGSADRERDGVEALIRRRVEAFIFTDPVHPDNVRLAMGSGIPVVQVDRPTAVPSSTVTADNLGGTRRAAEYLISLGLRRIAFMGRLWEAGSRDDPVEPERLRGYEEAMRDAGLPTQVQIGRRPTGPLAMQVLGRGYMRQILDEGPRPEAVLATSDLLAAGVLQALYERGLRVPDDIAVVGFGDTYASALAPALTTVALPMLDLGREALRCALDAGGRLHVRLPTQLIVRDSTPSSPRRPPRRRQTPSRRWRRTRTRWRSRA
ncbi:MAG TPA: LacI family DNA-binding transcriptional regulator [Candidatus Dormibacteraeota bacterium]|nr:LacI family DNA-binding transcriptional regulator [Candidatus Dormibacteraeota bacterium]